MTKALTFLSAAALVTALSSPALSCSMNKNASHKGSTIASVKAPSEEAMSTFDPKQPTAFKEKAEAKAEQSEEKIEPASE